MQDSTPDRRKFDDDLTPDPREVGRVDLRTGPEILANVLREKILNGIYPEGTALHPERELVTRAKLSRPTVRAALRILETEGLIETRQGRNGGSFVRRMDEEDLSRSLNLFIRGLPVDLTALIETRAVLETAIARYAAERRTENHIAEMEAIIDEMDAIAGDRPVELLRLNIKLRLAMARAAQNDLLTGIVHAFSNVSEPTTRDIQLAEKMTLQDRRDLVKANRRIVGAIATNNPEAAVRRMERQFQYVRDMIQQNFSDAPAAE